jgi:hypothetical protein
LALLVLVCRCSGVLTWLPGRAWPLSSLIVSLSEQAVLALAGFRCCVGSRLSRLLMIHPIGGPARCNRRLAEQRRRAAIRPARLPD